MRMMLTRIVPAALLATTIGLLIGCPAAEPPFGVVPPDEEFYVSANACAACHANIAAQHARSAHAQALRPVLSQPPIYPAPAPGVPAPPAGQEWRDIAYVIGGYAKAARFVDTQGFVTTGPGAQYDIPRPEVLLGAGYVPFLPDAAGPVGFEFDDFFRLTTGGRSFADNGGRRQDNRPGIGGTFAEPGVQCEACHGPGGLHVPSPAAGNIILDGTSTSCAACHTNQTRPGAILAGGGLIQGFQQSEEVAASPHARFACNVCHNPHGSTTYDPANAIRNECRACHANMDMGLHENLVYVQGDYVEPVTCVSCHMPYAVSTRSASTFELSNMTTATLGDTRSHIMTLDPTPAGLAAMFAEGGAVIAQDAAGRASISTCYVCLRCHNGLGNAFAFPAAEGCAFGADIHLRR